MALTIAQFAYYQATDFSQSAQDALLDNQFTIIPCPHGAEYKPGQVKMKYLNYTEAYLGYQSIVFEWAMLNGNDVETILDSYRASLNYGQTFWFFRWNGEKSEWQLSSGIMEKPAPASWRGENAMNFKLSFSKIGFHLNDEVITSKTDVWTNINGGLPYVYGISDYADNLWEQL